MSEIPRTTTTLLEGLRDPRNTQAWHTFHERYRPMILAYAKRRGLKDAEAEDAAQETLADFAKAYRRGQYDRSRGRLRHWLGGFAARRVARLLSKRGKRIQLISGKGKTAILHGVPDPDAPDQLWEQEWERYVLESCKARVRKEFERRQYRAFELYALEGRDANKVARELGVTRNTVYICKSRILARMRQIREELEASN